VAVARESMLRVLGQLLHPIAQLRRVNVQVLRRLHIGNKSGRARPNAVIDATSERE
jgi:hypothetical protein